MATWRLRRRHGGMEACTVSYETKKGLMVATFATVDDHHGKKIIAVSPNVRFSLFLMSSYGPYCMHGLLMYRCHLKCLIFCKFNKLNQLVPPKNLPILDNLLMILFRKKTEVVFALNCRTTTTTFTYFFSSVGQGNARCMDYDYFPC